MDKHTVMPLLTASDTARQRGGFRLPVAAAALLLLAAFPASIRRNETAVFAGGCFWGVEAVFEHLRGVHSAISGYASGHIEAVRISYDPAEISYRELLEVFFTIGHDPTQRDRQGPDAGPEYRAVVYYRDASQHQAAERYVSELERTQRFASPIVTEIQPVGNFRVAEGFHQDYAVRHPTDPYIVSNDLPKLERLRHEFPRLYREYRGLGE
jgi:peptide-methionine (S)-S-oxide reductase